MSIEPARLPPAESWLSLDQIEALGVPRRALHHYIKSGQVVTRGKGRELQVLEQSLPAALRDREPIGDQRSSSIPKALRAQIIGHRHALLTKLFALPRNARKSFAESSVIPCWNDIEGIDKFPALTKAPCYRSLSRLWRQCETEGPRAVLGYYKPRRIDTRQILPPEAASYIRSLHLRQHALRVTAVHKAYLKEAPGRGWPKVSYETVRQVLRAIPEDVAYLAKWGRRDYEAQRLPFIQRDERELEPGAALNGDHHQLDVLARCERTGKLFRPWLTAWQDIRSRAVPGWVFVRLPNSKTIIAAFAAAVQAKRRPEYALLCGVPDAIFVDNGKDYRSRAVEGAEPTEGDRDALRGLFPALHIDDVHHVLPYMPAAKPIERFFREVAEDFSSRLPGYVASNPSKKRHAELRKLCRQHKEFLAGKRRESPFLPMGEIADEFERWLFEYHSRPHDTLSTEGRKLSPLDVYRLYGDERAVPTDKALFFLTQESCPRTIQKNGIKIDGSWFWSTELFNHQGKVEVRRDPQEAGRVYVFDTRGNFLCEAIAADVLRTGASPDDVKAAMQRKREHRRLREAYLRSLVEEAPPDALTLRAAATAHVPPPPDAPPTGHITRLTPELDGVPVRQLEAPPEPPESLVLVPLEEPRRPCARIVAFAADLEEDDEEEYPAMVAVQE